MRDLASWNCVVCSACGTQLSIYLSYSIEDAAAAGNANLCLRLETENGLDRRRIAAAVGRGRPPAPHSAAVGLGLAVGQGNTARQRSVAHEARAARYGFIPYTTEAGCLGPRHGVLLDSGVISTTTSNLCEDPPLSPRTRDGSWLRNL